MGKPTGFMEFEREINPTADPLERIKSFDEFHGEASIEDRRRQGARCMNCGVAFCQSAVKLGGMVSGCPLHNLIPEWNDDIYRGSWKEALSRLLKTNNFPEFTGRVCPALCEAACTSGMNDSPVTVHDNELAIIEYGFKKGWVKPQLPPVRSDKRVAVVGSGPAGLAVAARLNYRGHNVTVFEKSDRVGGLLMYGIPNMKLDKKIVERRVRLMEAEGVRFVTNTDVDEKKAKELLRDYDAVVLCCGAQQPRDINAPGRKDAKGVYFAVDFLSKNTKSLLDSGFADKQYIDTKGKNVVIVGGGDTGNDCVGTSIRHGCKSVVQLEMMPKPPVARAESNPWPQFPRVLKTDYGQEEAIAVFGSDPRIYRTTVKEIICDKNGNLKEILTVGVEFGKDRKMTEIPGSEKKLKADILLIAAGFTGCKKYAADAFGVELNPRGTVKTEEDCYKTNAEKVFTAGDMHRGQSLVVWAIAEGRACAKAVDEYLMGYTNM